MVTGSRIGWFVIAFMFALPSMMLLFRGDDGITAELWGRSIPFALAIAIVVAAVFGGGKS